VSQRMEPERAEPGAGAHLPPGALQAVRVDAVPISVVNT
jgi:hypothetical protein